MARSRKRHREARHSVLLPVRITGCDMHGKTVQETACTLNVSHCGARLVGLSQRLKVGSTVRLEYHQEKALFEVVWTHHDLKNQQWEAGVHCLERKARIWRGELTAGLDPETFRHLLREALAESADGNQLR